VFGRCCEHTMRVLRENQAALITIVEVFIHDPLYRWALSPLQALRRQQQEEEVLGTATQKGFNNNQNMESNEDDDALMFAGGNTEAERALLRLKQKLQGYEYGEPLSVEG